MKRFVEIFLVAIIAFLLLSCSTQNNHPLSTQPSGYSIEAATSYPNLNELTAEDSYPGIEGGSEQAASEPEQFLEVESEQNGSLTTQLIYARTGKPLSKTQAYLTRAVGEENSVPMVLSGPNDEKGDIVAISDSNGVIHFENIMAGNYYLIVNYVTDYVIAQTSDKDLAPLLLTFNGNENKDFSQLYIPEN